MFERQLSPIGRSQPTFHASEKSCFVSRESTRRDGSIWVLVGVRQGTLIRRDQLLVAPCFPVGKKDVAQYIGLLPAECIRLLLHLLGGQAVRLLISNCDATSMFRHHSRLYSTRNGVRPPVFIDRNDNSGVFPARSGVRYVRQDALFVHKKRNVRGLQSVDNLRVGYLQLRNLSKRASLAASVICA